jgi:FKBP-type peptidyl-prolyl cis-trans isomerase
MSSRLFAALTCVATLAACTLKSDFSQPADAQVTPSGLASKILRVGLGDKFPAANSTVTVHYTGWTPDGTVFDSSVNRGKPETFPLNRVIPGWTEALQLMRKGEKRRFWIPAKLAYGDVVPGQPAYTPNSGQPPLGPLVFDIDLIEIWPPTR